MELLILFALTKFFAKSENNAGNIFAGLALSLWWEAGSGSTTLGVAKWLAPHLPAARDFSCLSNSEEENEKILRIVVQSKCGFHTDRKTTKTTHFW